MEPVYLYAYNLLENGVFSSTSVRSGVNRNIMQRARESGILTFNLVVWHTSIVMYGKEISFGMEGIKIEDLKGQNETEKPGLVKKMLMGYTGISFESICSYLEYLSQNAFTARKYNVFNYNCNVFTAFLCKNLLGKDIPEQYSSAVLNFFKRLGLLICQDFALHMLLKAIPFKSSSCRM